MNSIVLQWCGWNGKQCSFICECQWQEVRLFHPLILIVNLLTKQESCFLRRFNPDAIVFDSSKVYGTPSYWMQHIFKESNGAILLDSKLQSGPSSLLATAISWTNPDNNKNYVRIKVWVIETATSFLQHSAQWYHSYSSIRGKYVYQWRKEFLIMLIWYSWLMIKVSYPGCELWERQSESSGFDRRPGQQVHRSSRFYIDYTNIWQSEGWKFIQWAKEGNLITISNFFL